MSVADIILSTADRFELDSSTVKHGKCYFSKAARAWVIRSAVNSGHSFSKVARILNRDRSTIREIYMRVNI